MLVINSFLRMLDGSFIRVEVCKTSPSDPDYVEGAIEIVIDGKEIIGKREWDYVDQLWAYLATMLNDFRSSDKVATYFPDQPIELSFTRAGDRVLISSKLGGTIRTGSVDEADFWRRFRQAGEAFFDRITELNPAAALAYATAREELTSDWH